MVSTIVQENLRAQSLNSSPGLIAYCYCSRNDSTLAERSADAIIRNILKQLSCNFQDGQIHPSVRKEFEERKAVATKKSMKLLPPSIGDCTSMLLSILEDYPATIIIDGLDEIDCDPSKVILPLKGLIKKSPNILKILIASRTESTISSHLHDWPGIGVSPLDDSGDISLFIETSLSLAIQERRLLQGNVSTELHELIARTLNRGASSMFLWASLHIHQLCNQHKFKLERDVVDALASLPSSLRSVLHEIYSRIEQYPAAAKEVAERIVSWLLVAERPLTKSELLTAISCVTTHSLSTETILSLCSGFIARDGATDQITFVHPSIREYL